MGATITRSAGEAGGTSWAMATREVPAPLHGLVDAPVRWTETSDVTIWRTQTPGPRLPIIIPFDAPLGTTVPGKPSEMLAPRLGFIAGFHDRPVVTEQGKVSGGVQVDLTPAGAARLLGMPMGEIASAIVPLDDLFGPTAAALNERLAGARDDDAVFEIVDRFLLRLLDLGHEEPPAEVVHAWDRIEASGGCARIAVVAEEVSWTPSKLHREFLRWVGHPPKTVARVVRFGRAMEEMRASRDPEWAGIAADLGYYDQSHLIRDFKEFTGATPEVTNAARIGDGPSIAAEPLEILPIAGVVEMSPFGPGGPE